MTKTKRIFIFAHCDDELFCLPFLLDPNSENTLVFITSKKGGDSPNQKYNIRSSEALDANRYLNKFQSIETLFFDHEIYDGSIHKDFDKAKFDLLTQIIIDKKPDELVTLSFEAGHQDHDSVAFISRSISEKLNLKLWSCSSYHASRFSWRFYSVMKPYSPAEEIPFKRFEVVTTAIRLMFIYKSQFKTWFGLAPALLFRYCFFPFRVSKVHFNNEPEYFPNCFYEVRKRATQSEVLFDLKTLAITIESSI